MARSPSRWLKRSMVGSLGLLAAVVAILACRPPQDVDYSKLTAADWREDVRYLARELPKRHKDAFHFTTRARFDSAVAALDAAIPSLAAHQVMVRMLQITSSVGDIHTSLALPSSYEAYPVSLYWYEGKLRVQATTAQYHAILGGSVVAIDGMPIDSVMTRLRTVIPQDENEWLVLLSSASLAARSEVLHALGVAHDLSHAEFTVTQDDGTRASADVAPVAVSATAPIQLTDTAAASPPLYRQRPADLFWFTMLPDSQTAYVAFRSYDKLSDRVKELFAFMDAHRATSLLIDMRLNAGGDYTKGREILIPAIKKRPTLNAKGHLFVAIGRRTLSAAMVNTIDFRKETNATLVGEPVGERPNSFQEGAEMTLPHSRLTVSYSTRYYKFLDQDAPTVEPDQRVDPLWADFRAGRDGVVEWVLARKAP